MPSTIIAWVIGAFVVWPTADILGTPGEPARSWTVGVPNLLAQA